MKKFIDLHAVSVKSFFVEFRKLFVVFWVFSFFGHYLEIFWSWLNFTVFGSDFWIPNVPTILPLAPPYGLGVVAVIIFTYPMIKRREFGPIEAFVVNIFISGLVEYLSAAFLVAVVGYNRFWDYSDQPFNINGYICLENSLLFGVGVTLFLYYIYPLYLKAIKHLRAEQIDVLFWIMLISYGLDLIYLNIK